MTSRADESEDHGFLNSFKGRLRRARDSLVKPSSPSSRRTDLLSPSNSGFQLFSRSRPTTPTPGTKLPTSNTEERPISPSPKPPVQSDIAGAETSAPTADNGSHNGAWDRLARSLSSLENVAELFPPLKSAVGLLFECLDIFQVAASNHQDYQQLAEELGSILDALNQYAGDLDSEASNGSIANIARCIQEQVTDIKEIKARGVVGQLLDATQDQEDVIRRYRRIESLFRRLQCDVSLRTRSDVKKQLEMSLLRGISPVDDGRYNSSYSTTIKRHGCTAETREHIQSVLQEWATDFTSQKIYWMNGMAGTGKTTIAYSLCRWLEDTNRLGASFFCSRTSLACRSLNRIVPTLAYQLARYSSAFRAALCFSLTENPDAATLNVVQQFEQLIYEPSLKAKAAIPDGVVVVIDALDECDDSYSVHLLLEVLLKYAEQLPLKFFVASRPEHVIRDRMLAREGASRSIIHLHDIEQSIVEGDIKKYITDALSSMSPPPSPEQIHTLAKRAGKLFIYAATVVRYVHPRVVSVDSSARLEVILTELGTSEMESDNIYKDLDHLYTTVLNDVFGDHLGRREKECIQRVLWTVVCAKEPMPAAAVASLATLTERQVWSALESLRSVLHVPEDKGLISTLHASFPEYMLDLARSKELHCEESQFNEVLVKRCFDIMKSELRFNICNLSSSYLIDDQLQDLEARVAKYISPALSYVCRYWGKHLLLSSGSNNVLDMVFDFLSTRLLFWMEVLNLKRSIGVGAPMLHQVQTWMLQVGNTQVDFQKMVSDARNFVTWFAANPCSQSTPHIYVSALALCAKSNWVYQHYSEQMTRIPNIAISQRDEAVLAIWSFESAVNSVAVSPHGDCIVSGADNGAIYIHDIHTGATINGPFKGHTGYVLSVVFSPNGTHIASGSADHTVIIWDAHTGGIATGPLIGHTDLIWSVAFSPDGNLIVSGSSDHTVIVWDCDSGNIVAGPLRGHSGIVNSVAFSPDGRLVASGSQDQTVRLWDTNTEAPVPEVLKGHESSVTGVAFLPNGNRLLSCSYDKSIRVWDVKTRTTSGSPLESRQGPIWSLAVSLDGAYIVSGGDDKDKSIMVWDSQTGSVVLGPLRGHTDWIRSAIFSPDNTRVISSSDDKTIRIWDVQTKDRATDQTNTREISVGPLAFSADHAQFISYSSNSSLQVWDLHTGAPISHLFQKEADIKPIDSIAFSPQGSHAAAASTSNLTIRVWSLSTGKTTSQTPIGHKGSINCLVFSPNGAQICSGSDDSTIIIWDTETGIMTGQPFKGHTGSVWSVAYSPTGALIVSGATDYTVRLWDSSTGAPIHAFNEHKSAIGSVAFSPDESIIISGSVDGVILKWEIGNGNYSYIPFEFNNRPDLGSAAASGPNPGSDPDRGSNLDSNSSSNSKSGSDSGSDSDSNSLLGLSSSPTMSANWVSFSPDSSRIVSGFGASIRIFDAQTTELVETLRLPSGEQVRWVRYSPGGTDLISVSTPERGSAQLTSEEPSHQTAQNSNIIRVWRYIVPPEQATLPTTQSYWSYKPDGRILSPEGFVAWVSPDLLPYMEVKASSYYNPFVLSPDGIIDIGYKNLCIGERWSECYAHNA